MRYTIRYCPDSAGISIFPRMDTFRLKETIEELLLAIEHSDGDDPYIDLQGLALLTDRDNPRLYYLIPLSVWQDEDSPVRDLWRGF